jgi:hypothetical protein
MVSSVLIRPFFSESVLNGKNSPTNGTKGQTHMPHHTATGRTTPRPRPDGDTTHTRPVPTATLSPVGKFIVVFAVISRKCWGGRQILNSAHTHCDLGKARSASDGTAEPRRMASAVSLHGGPVWRILFFVSIIPSRLQLITLSAQESEKHVWLTTFQALPTRCSRTWLPQTSWNNRARMFLLTMPRTNLCWIPY